MTRRPGQIVQILLLAIGLALFATRIIAAPYASMVMDMRTGEVIASRNADTQLHPASLTKMMTLYIAFEAIEHGEISLDTMVTVSANAASEPPSKLGLRAGQQIALRYLIRAAAVKSANDAATAIGEAIEGSEAAFARRMNRTAQALGMTRTHFKNANGLTETGHMSTARDMTILGRHLFFDYPEYYNLFSRRTADVGGREVANTNTRFLNAYRGADGIKTGYTVAAGFNLVASAERDGKRIIATIFGGASTAARNDKMAQLLDMGFGKAPTRVTLRPPSKPAYQGPGGGTVVVASGDSGGGTPAAGKVIRLVTAPTTSIRPLARPGATPEAPPVEMIAAIESGIDDVLEGLIAEESEAVTETAAVVPEAVPVPPPRPDAVADAVAEALAVVDPVALTEIAPDAEALPQPEPAVAILTDAEADLAPFEAPTETPVETLVADADAADATLLAAAPGAVAEMIVPEPAIEPVPDNIILTAVEPTAEHEEVAQEVVTRLSTSGGRHWGVNVGRYGSEYEAERVLLKTALIELTTLGEALRKVSRNSRGFEANFMGLTQESAELACRRLEARSIDCSVIGPS